MVKGVIFSENTLKAQDFARLRQSVGWKTPSADYVEKALSHNLFSVTASLNGEVIGMARLVGDGILIWYIQDVVILPEYQHSGIGKAIVERLLDFIRSNKTPGFGATIGLMSAKGKEGFYEELGFISRPNDNRGPGMYMTMDE